MKKIYATYKGHKSERTFLLSGICLILLHIVKEPANVLKKFNAEARILWILINILNK